MDKKFKAGTYITPITDVSTCTSDERLGTALSLIRSSHDPVFVINENGEFVGLVSLNYAIFEKRFPVATKVKNCLLNPPQITPETPVSEVAQYMVDTRLYTLPVFNESGKLSGIISSPVMLRGLSRNSTFIDEMSKSIKTSDPETAEASITITEAYNQLRKTGSSRLLLLDEKKKIAGIITRRDIETAFAKHRKKERFTASIGRTGVNLQRIDQNVPVEDKTPAIEFASKSVITISENDSIKSAIKRMIESRVPSIVIVDKYRIPKSIISTKSFLSAIAESKQAARIPIIFHHGPDGPTKDYRIQQLTSMLEKFGEKINKRMPVQRIELTIEQPKNPVGKTVAYSVKLYLLLWSGESYMGSADSFVARSRHIGLETNVREAIKEIQRQIERDTDNN